MRRIPHKDEEGGSTPPVANRTEETVSKSEELAKAVTFANLEDNIKLAIKYDDIRRATVERSSGGGHSDIIYIPMNDPGIKQAVNDFIRQIEAICIERTASIAEIILAEHNKAEGQDF